MKSYNVYYYIKADGIPKYYTMPITAANAKEACQQCKAIVKEQTGRNAFKPTTKRPANCKLEA